MRRRFVPRRNEKQLIFKVIISLILIYFLWLGVKIIFNLFKASQPETRVNEYLAIGSDHLIGKINLLDLKNLNLNSPETFLKLSFNNFKTLAYQEEPVLKETIPVNKETTDPLVYIYNTHQTEGYSSGSLSVYNITPTVYMASTMLQKALGKEEINAIVEEANISKLLKAKGWSYNRSYEITRELLKTNYAAHPTLDYFIDLHRDSASGTVTIAGNNYAQMMFVIGMNHDGYTENEALVLKIYNYLNENYPTVIKKSFYSKNNRYNQDHHPHTLLIEVGGPENSIDEVYNSVNILAEAISKVVNNQ